MVIGIMPEEGSRCSSPTVAILTREDLRAEMQRELRQLMSTFERQLCDTSEQLRTHIREDSRHIQMLAQMSTSEEMQRIFSELREVFRNQSITGPGKLPVPPSKKAEVGSLPNVVRSTESTEPQSRKKQDPMPLMLVDIEEEDMCCDKQPSSGKGNVSQVTTASSETSPCKPVMAEPHKTWTEVMPGTVGSATPSSARNSSKQGVLEAHLSRKNTRHFTHSSTGDKDDSVATRQPSRMIVSHKTRARISTAHGNIATDAAIDKSRSAMSSSNASTCSRLQHRLLDLVNHPVFDYIVTAIILLNGVMVGVQTHMMALQVSDVTPVPFQVLEWIFCVVFTAEISLRLFAYRTQFFTMSGKGWNIFDLLIVTLQLVEIMMEIVAAGLGFSFNLLRILRLIRVIRLARALRLIAELRTIVSSIAGSLKSLLWTGVLLFMIVYVLGVGITQHVLNKRIAWQRDNAVAPDLLEHYWGDLIRSVFSLFESITGGVDWDQVARPLIDHVGVEMALIFTLYITFAVLAMLNVVTGVFIESVMKNASLENELRTQMQLTNLFRSLDLNHHGEISWDQFSKQLHDSKMKEFFKTIDVDISNARGLFDLLDLDGSESVNAEEFVDGCLRIWAPSKGLDLRMIRREVTRMSKLLEQLLKIEIDAGSCDVISMSDREEGERDEGINGK